MAAAVAARIMWRPTTTSGRTAAVRAISASTPRITGSASSNATLKPLSARIFELPVEMSCVRVQSMMPYHSATASALMISMLSVTPRSYGWTLEGS